MSLKIIMKKLSFNWHSFISSLCMSCLALLGFSCSSSDGDEPAMYGTPTADFEVKGIVTDSEGNPIGDVEVRITKPDFPSSYSLDTDMTSASGAYALEGTCFSARERLKVVFLPTDASLEADSTIVTLEPVSEGDGGWYNGVGEATVNMRLKNKTAE